MAARRGERPRGPRGVRGQDKRPKPKRAPRSVRRGALQVTPSASDADSGDGKIRLNRFLASAGVCSRRGADDLIVSGRVAINGTVVRELGMRIDPTADRVAVDHEPVQPERHVYVLFNKPREVVCTNARNEQRRRVIDYLDDVHGRLYTIGRLDADSEGLILLTNDGDFANSVAHPRYGVPKTYAVLVKGRIDDSELGKARGGVWLAEGKTAGAQIRVERRSRDRSYLKVMIREGKNREIRRVFARLGYPVISLKRIRIGRLNLHGLKAGRYRFLRPEEVQQLLASAREGEV